MRADSADSARRRDRVSIAASAVVLLATAAVAIWQAGSVQAGAYVTGGLIAIVAILGIASRVVVRIIMPLARSTRFALRHAVVGLGRPGNQTRVILIAVGLGCFFILTVRLVQISLVEELTVQVGQNAPDFVLIDIQPDQASVVMETIAAHAVTPPRLLPLLRARIVGVDGARVRLGTIDDVRERNELAREFGLTFRTTLEPNEAVISGRFWDAPLTSPLSKDIDTEVSLEEDLHNESGLQIGDVVRFDAGGRVLRARITSIRHLTWEEMQNGGFVFVLRPAPAVDQAPYTMVGFVKLPDDPARRVAFQRALISAAPNVSAIDVRDIMQSIRDVVDNVMLGVTVVGGVMLVGGIAILVGAVAMTRFQRLYEAAIYRTLGASTRLLSTMVFVEYGLLGIVAGLLGAGGALVLSYLLATYLFDIDWVAAPAFVAAGVILTALLVSVVGWAASVDVLRRKPLTTLRQE